jgi:hypothetical protein
LIPP